MMRLRLPFILLALIPVAFGQFGYNHPELEWQTIEGEYFIVHYHQNTEWTANEALHIADDVYPYITGLYQYEPEQKTHIIIRDTDDFANGAAYYFDNKIDIWAMPLDYSLRGSHYWLRDVITHEFTHIVSLRAARKMPGNVPSAYLQIIEYEPERREDVLYGYPNGLAAYPLPSVNVPMWWAEGVAQYQCDEKRFDWWDGIRDMIVRDRLAYGKLLNFNEMDGFGKGGIGNESVYNHGFNFVHYLARRFGPDILRDITERLQSPTSYSFYRVMSAATGVDYETLYRDWQTDLATRYAEMFPAEASPTLVEKVHAAGAANYQPRFNSVDSTLGFISSSGETYMSRTSLWELKPGEEAEKLISGAEGFDWAPDGQQLVFVRKEFYDGGIPASRLNIPRMHLEHEHPGTHSTCARCDLFLSGSRFADLFVVDRDDVEEETRLTMGERVKNPVWSPDGKSIAFVNLRDGTNNLCLAFPEHPDSVLQLTTFTGGTQVYYPRWSPDGQQIIFDHTDGRNRDISRYDLRTRSFIPMLVETWDEREPVFLDDTTIVYSDDRTGIFNLYRYDLRSGMINRLTHVNGGAFQAEPAGEWIYYSLYDSLGYNIARIHRDDWVNDAPAYAESYLERIPDIPWEPHPKTRLAHDYTLQYGPMFIVPRVQIEVDRLKGKTIFKPGFYFFSNEILDNYLILGSMGIAPNKDMDIFMMAEYHGFLPTFSLEFYRMVRNTQEELTYINNWKVDSDLQFVLTQGIAAMDVIIPKDNRIRLDLVAGDYQTHIDEHLLNGYQLGGIGYTYFKGWDYGLTWRKDRRALRQERDINPSGYWLELGLRDNHHRFLTGYGYKEETDSWGNIMTPFRYLRTDFRGFYGYRIPFLTNTVLSNKLDLTFIDNNGIDDFFWEFAGGLPGLRGYPFYSLKGTRKVVNSTDLRFPLLRNSYSRLAQLTLRDIYLGLHAQVGSAWGGPEDPSEMDIQNYDLNPVWRKDVGVSLRVNWFSFYAFPTAMELGSYYGLDEFTVVTETETIPYGGEWRFYWRLLFNFE